MKLSLKANAIALVAVFVMMTGSVVYGQSGHGNGQSQAGNGNSLPGEMNSDDGVAAMQMSADRTCQAGGASCGAEQKEVADVSRQIIKEITNGSGTGETANLRTGGPRPCAFCVLNK